MSKTPAPSILKNDPRLADTPDFKELRELGLEYISKLSGALWTDHNLHDPGITTLEVLCYALTDLGYRTSLDEAELFAPGKGKPEDNFYTPEEILTNNPLTILDYRKMLVDIPGVRNAWIEPATDQELGLWYRTPTKDDCEVRQLVVAEKNSEGYSELQLNGLYRVFLEIDPLLTQDEADCSASDASIGNTLMMVRKRLQAHRNLCEDFLEVVTLKDEEVGICLEADLDAKANPEEVLGRIFSALEEFISPRLKFYNLAELLRQGKPMEEIFRGRPSLAAYAQHLGGADKISHGFVDEKQLEELKLPTVIRASDLYRVIMNVDGVRAIRELQLVNFLEGIPQTDGEEWELRLTPRHRPLFAPDRGTFKFFKGKLRVPVNRPSVAARFRRRLADYQKSLYAQNKLDEAIPYGRHREDLGDYYSIQQEFPVVYGIKEDELSRSASPERKMQMWQLRGFLSFFDQLLANYFAQLANARQLFSWSDSSKQSYFDQGVDSIPGVKDLLRFYQGKTNEGRANSIVCNASPYDHPINRDQAIAGLVEMFRNSSLEELKKRLKVVGDKVSGYSFQILDAQGGAVLQSKQTFRLKDDAKAASEAAALKLIFQGGIQQNYRHDNVAADRMYGFTIIDDPASYGNFLKEMTENETTFGQRRNQMLDHMLARFDEQFTDYALLMYALNLKEQDTKEIIRDKENFLAEYPKISRERGKGFDYTQKDKLWDSNENLSGLEQRVSRLMGLSNWQRRNLSQWQVHLVDQAQRLVWKDHRGRVMLRSVNGYADLEQRNQVAQTILKLLDVEAAYRRHDCPEESVFGYTLVDESGKPIAEFPQTFPTADLRDAHLNCTQLYFGESDGFTLELGRKGRQQYHFDLTVINPANGEKERYWTAKSTYPNQEAARQAGQDLMAAIRAGTVKMARKPNGTKVGYGIELRTTGTNVPLVAAVLPQLQKERDACKAILEQRKAYHASLLPQNVGMRVVLDKEAMGYYFAFYATDGQTIILRTSETYPEQEAACTAGLQLLAAAREREHYQVTDLGSRFGFSVVFNSDTIGVHPQRYDTPQDRADQLEKVHSFFAQRSLDYRLEQTAATYRWYQKAGLEGPILRSPHEFLTEAEARANWTAMRADWSAKKLLVAVDQNTDGWWAKLVRPDGVALAITGPYEDRDAAYDALDAWRAYAEQSETEAGIQYTPEQWFFVLYHDAEIALVGQRRYDTKDQAACAFLKFTELAKDPEYYEDQPDPDGCHLSFAVVAEGEILARHPEFYADEIAAKKQSEMQQMVADKFIRCSIEHQELNWTYRILWEDCFGHCASLLQSEGEGWVEAVEARQAAKELINSIQTTDDLATTQEGNGYSFAVLKDGDLRAKHSNHYPSEVERDRILEDAVAYFRHYHDLSFAGFAGLQLENAHFPNCDNLIHPCKPAKEENQVQQRAQQEEDSAEIKGNSCLMSAYRLQKDDAPEAEHPHFFRTAEARDKLAQQIFTAVQCGQLNYLTIEVGTVAVRCSQRKKDLPSYAYVWIIAGENCWQSVRTYESKQAAKAAFTEDFPHFLSVATKHNHYESMAVADHLEKLRDDCWPLTAGDFTEYCTHQFGDALKLVLTKDGFPVLFAPGLDAADPASAIQGRNERIQQLKQYPFRWGKEDGWTYGVPDLEGASFWLRSSKGYQSLKAVQAAFSDLLALLTFWPNYHQVDKPQAKIFRLEIITTLLDGKMVFVDQQEDLEEASRNGRDKLAIHPAHYPEKYYTVGDKKYQVSASKVPAKAKPFAPKAWDLGLDTFLASGVHRDNYYTFIDPTRDCHLGFRVVQADYRLARNPRESHTPHERELLLEWLQGYVNCRTVDCEVLGLFTQDYLDYRSSKYLCFKYQGQSIWRAAEPREVDQPTTARELNYVKLLGYAQEPDFYHYIRTETNAAGDMLFRIQLRDETGTAVLESLDTYTAAALREEVESRILQARRYPIYYYDGKFGFQYFSEIEVPDFSRTASQLENNTNEPDSAVVAGEVFAPTNTCDTAATSLVIPQLPGEVIWESVQEYDSLAAAEEAFCCFAKLLQDLGNYQRQQLENCSLFGLEITHPGRVLAEHPRRYPGPQRLEKAIQETLECVNNEGFHLIEHLLLRPREMGDATIPNICPVPETAEEKASFLCCPEIEEIGEQDKQSNYVAMADPYSFWATIILPFWPQRFQNSNFRSFFEDTLRREAPAHVALKICWLDPLQLRDFERSYRRWLETLGREDNCARQQAQQALVEILSSLTTVYPAAQLDAGDCGTTTTDTNAVLLDFTQLS